MQRKNADQEREITNLKKQVEYLLESDRRRAIATKSVKRRIARHIDDFVIQQRLFDDGESHLSEVDTTVVRVASLAHEPPALVVGLIDVGLVLVPIAAPIVAGGDPGPRGFRGTVVVVHRLASTLAKPCDSPSRCCSMVPMVCRYKPTSVSRSCKRALISSSTGTFISRETLIDDVLLRTYFGFAG